MKGMELFLSDARKIPVSSPGEVQGERYKLANRINQFLQCLTQVFTAEWSSNVFIHFWGEIGERISTPIGENRKLKMLNVMLYSFIRSKFLRNQVGHTSDLNSSDHLGQVKSSPIAVASPKETWNE